jgi:thymidylate synthase
MYWRGMNLLRTDGRDEDSRNGRVRVMPEPVTSVYRYPCQRVLLDFKRAANPFFHLFESLWMLAGRNDVAALNRYITDFGTRFAEADGTVHGAYGHRWRKAFGFDQLESIVHKLKTNPQDRQCVLQMWDGRANAVKFDGEILSEPFGSNDLDGNWKDRPCNTQVYFRLRKETSVEGLGRAFTTPDSLWPVLDMLVTCRSNDIVYGAYGANAVHFSILHEYMAGRLGGVVVGKMEQLSFNYHAYHDVLERVGCPSHLETYAGHKLKPSPMVHDGDKWDEDLSTFMTWHGNLIATGNSEAGTYANKWFKYTAEPMFLAHYKWKSAMHKEARTMAQLVESEDWRFAALQWFDVRSNARSR